MYIPGAEKIAQFASPADANLVVILVLLSSPFFQSLLILLHDTINSRWPSIANIVLILHTPQA